MYFDAMTQTLPACSRVNVLATSLFSANSYQQSANRYQTSANIFFIFLY